MIFGLNWFRKTEKYPLINYLQTGRNKFHADHGKFPDMILLTIGQLEEFDRWRGQHPQQSYEFGDGYPAFHEARLVPASFGPIFAHTGLWKHQ